MNTSSILNHLVRGFGRALSNYPSDQYFRTSRLNDQSHSFQFNRCKPIYGRATFVGVIFRKEFSSRNLIFFQF